MSNISVKPKLLGLLFFLLGLGLLLLSTADMVYLLFYLDPNEPLLETILYTASDVAFYATTIVALIVSAKLLKTK